MVILHPYLLSMLEVAKFEALDEGGGQCRMSIFKKWQCRMSLSLIFTNVLC